MIPESPRINRPAADFQAISARSSSGEKIRTHVVWRLLVALRGFHPLSGVNAVLRVRRDVELAKAQVQRLGLSPHRDEPKNWDCFRAVSVVVREGNIDSRVLDVGAPTYSVILPWLEQLGLRNLEACDVCYTDDEFQVGHIRYTKQDLLHTSFPDASFDFVTSISVIEHGVDPERYFREMCRVLNPGGYLLTSTDYWPDPIDCEGLFPYGVEMGPMKVFTRREIEELIDTAARYGFRLTEPIDFSCRDRVVHWKRVDRRFTFIFFALRKIKN